jgi:isopentenyl-diphosphate delta-isomerase
MKTLKFKQDLVKLIESGEKTTTFRLFDDKDLEVGDTVDLFVDETGYQFGVMTIIEVIQKTLNALEESDWKGHERYGDEEEMYSQFQKFYGAEVGPATEIKIVRFIFEPKLYKKVVVVDDNDKVIGSEYMRIAANLGLIRRAARIYVFNESRQLLVQQRSAKVAKPLLLDQSAAGHVDEGESYEEAAKRELFEELGLSDVTLAPVEISFRTTNFYNAIYKAVIPDDTQINFDPEELVGVFWYDISQLEHEMRVDPDKFTSAFKETWTELGEKIIAT